MPAWAAGQGPIVEELARGGTACLFGIAVQATRTAQICARPRYFVLTNRESQLLSSIV